MEHIPKTKLLEMGKIKRLNIINAITGAKPANLIGTRSESGQENIAIFSSVVHLGSNPALLGFFVRPTDDVPRHTFENIINTGFYTINHVHTDIIEKAHYTSAKFDRDASEFEVCDLPKVYRDSFPAPFLEGSPLGIAMRYEESIPIPLNGTQLIIGSVEGIYIQENAINEKGQLRLDKLNTVAISGLDTYYKLVFQDRFPYARPSENPFFK